MPESSLSLTYYDFAAAQGEFLGWGRGEEYGDPAWTSRQAAAIEADVASGQRQFYFPPLLPGEKVTHSWTFLKPVHSLSLASAATEVDLPEDFLELCGQVVVSSSASSGIYTPLKLYNPTRIRQLYSETPDATGYPEIAALDAIKGVGPTESSRYKLKVFPAADQAYTLEFQYKIAPEAINGARQYCYGGLQHVETILAACKMASEQNRNDKVGLWSNKFMELLVKSVMDDRKNQAKWHGSNPNAWGRPSSRSGRHGDSVVTIGGVDPTL